MKTLHFAHPMCCYGTLCEQAELAAIRSAFRKISVVNPSHYDDHPEKRNDTVGFCLRLIERCDFLVYSRLLGKMTAGVGKEINHALRLGIPVYELRPKFFVRRYRAVKYLSRKATVSLYKKWRMKRGGNPEPWLR